MVNLEILLIQKSLCLGYVLFTEPSVPSDCYQSVINIYQGVTVATSLMI